jgi:deoxyribodipyrimidine photo-lyase
MTAAILWFRNELRLNDNPALMAALDGADGVLPVFVLDDAAPGVWKLGGASRWWLHHSLASLAKDLQARGSTLCLRRGDARKIIPELAAETGAREIHAGRSFEPWARALDRDVAAALKAAGVAFKRHLTSLLFPPEEIKTKTGGIYGVYSPFSRACFEREPPPALAVPETIPGTAKIASGVLDDWRLLPVKPDWASGFKYIWQPGEAGAKKRLDEFIPRALHSYKDERNLPGQDGTSGLSPHLHFGEISPGQVWRAAQGAGAGPETFLKEILWREFAAYLLWHHKDLPDKPLRENFERFPWTDGKTGLRAWQRGQTGIPIVDAGMRQLWQTGWMHNRVRMITASFLVKHLLIPWQDGEKWFWDCLVDADLASNAASWQWVAGCGADAAPYFRIFNPVLQGKKFDPDGAYVRRYVPELAEVPIEYIHEPWQAPLTAANYPKPIVSLSEGRDRALAAFKSISGSRHD